MNKDFPSFNVFVDQVGGLFTLATDDNVTRVWGFLANRNKEIVTFWQVDPKKRFTFMFLASYQTPTTLAEKEEEKLAKGYQQQNARLSRHRSLVKAIHRDYLETLANDSFYYLPKNSISAK
jgi:hypothetical protein